VSPRHASGKDIYTLADMKSLQDWVLERELRRVPRIIGLANFGGEVKRYEVRPDPEQLRRYGVTLQQLQNAIANSNANVGAGFLTQGGTPANVRGVGLLGRGIDPVQGVLTVPWPQLASRRLRDAEAARARDIGRIVVTAV